MKMRKYITLFCAAALIGCSQNQGGPTVFQGRFIGYNDEFVEFFLPQEDGDFLELQVHVQPDGSFCDTLQFDKNYYDAPLFADKFMFRVSVEQGKTYNAEFDLTEEGVETNFRFIGEGAAENSFMAHLWASEAQSAMKEAATSFKECQKALKDSYAPLREELSRIPNKPFVKYYQEELDQKEENLCNYYPFYAIVKTGVCPDDADFDAFVARKKKMTDEEFQNNLSFYLTNAAYVVSGVEVTEALKAAASCADTPERKEWAMSEMFTQMVNAGNIDGLGEAYDYLADKVKNEEYLDQAYELCNNALLLAPGSDAPDIEFETLDGTVHHLSEFKGKPVYVDLWASWCGPCCEEIPYLAKFVESLGSHPEIACISISIDHDRDSWVAKLQEVGSAWPQFLATEAGQAAITSQYFVTGIPRFLLIDADGKIASVNAPRPSTPNLLDELKASL